MAMHHGDRVHYPRHRLRVRVNIRRRNVPIRPDDWSDFERISSCKSLEFIFRKAFGIANHAPLAAAIRDADGGAFPGHPRGQRLHFIEGYVRMIANAALSWTAR